MLIQESFGDIVQLSGVRASYIFLHIVVLNLKLYITIFVITIIWTYKIAIYQNEIFLFLFFGSFEIYIGNILR